MPLVVCIRTPMFEQSPESLSDIEILDILQSMKKDVGYGSK